ncbi:MAG TPA: GatB/YqeY domain-containing protein [Gaiellales bacterium]
MIARIQAELRAAMLAGDRSRVGALRLMLSALQKAEKDGAAGAFSEADAEAVLRRERKQRIEAAEAYRAAGHADRAAHEEADVPVIDEFLPAAMDAAELVALVDAAIAETGATSMRDMGKVMGLVTKRGAGRVDGKAASALVRERLTETV